MANKAKKKRTKRYSGEDAKQFNTPAANKETVITRIEAADRSRAGQWYHERKRLIKISALTAGGAGLIGWFAFELFRLAL